MVTREYQRKSQSGPNELDESDLTLIQDYIRELAPLKRPAKINDYAIVYARYSSNLQREESIDIQDERGVRYAKKLGFRLRPGKYLFADSKLSGTELAHREELESLRKLAREGGFTKLLIKGVDRLSRTSWQAYMLLEEFATLGIEVHIVGDVSHGLLDPTKAFIDGFFAWREHQKILADTRNGLEAAAWRGENLATIPYGYKRSGRGSMCIDEKKKPVVIRILDEFACGLSGIRIAKGLNDDGIPGPSGGKWSATQIVGSWQRGNGIVRQIKYLGINHYNRTERYPIPGSDAFKVVMRPRSEWILVKKPEWSLVPDDLWRRVMWRLNELARRRKATREAKAAGRPGDPDVGMRERHSDKAVLLFHDRYFCSCGARMWGYFTNNQTRALVCSSVRMGGGCDRTAHTSAAHVDGEVLRIVRHELLTDESVELFQKQYAEGAVEARETTFRRQKVLTAAIAEMTRRIDRTYRRIVDADEPDLDEERNYRDYRRERDQLQLELGRLRLPGPLPDLGPDAVASLKDQIDELIVRLPFVERTKEDMRLVAALRDVVRRIEIDRPRPRYGFTLDIQTTLSGLRTGPPAMGEDNGRLSEPRKLAPQDLLEAPPIRSFRCVVGAPTTTYFGRREWVDRLAAIAADGRYRITDEDWNVAAGVLIDYKGLEPRKLVDAALFSLRAEQGLWVLPPPYDKKSFARRLHAMIAEGHFGRVFEALKEIESPSVAGLDAHRFASRRTSGPARNRSTLGATQADGSGGRLERHPSDLERR